MIVELTDNIIRMMMALQLNPGFSCHMCYGPTLLKNLTQDWTYCFKKLCQQMNASPKWSFCSVMAPTRLCMQGEPNYVEK